MMFVDSRHTKILILFLLLSLNYSLLLGFLFVINLCLGMFLLNPLLENQFLQVLPLLLIVLVLELEAIYSLQR